MGDARAYSIELAFRRLRMGVLGCCWIVGVALAAQLVIWSLTRFTDVRYETRVPTAPAAQIVTGGGDDNGRLRPIQMLSEAQAAHRIAPVDLNRTFSKFDQIFREASILAAAIGKLSYAMLMPLLAVGVFLSAGSGTAGVHKSVSAFTWSLVLAVLMLPVGSLVEWPALTGAFYHYDTMIATVDAASPVQQAVEAAAAAADDGAAVPQSLTMIYARYLMLPAVCLVSVILIGFRFSLGVEASLLHRETRQFDPVLEREASNRSATSLMGGGGRSAGALSRVIGSPLPAAPSSPAVARVNGAADERMPGATKVSAGEAPRRLI